MIEEHRVNLFPPAVPAAAWIGAAQLDGDGAGLTGARGVRLQDSRTCTWTRSMQIKVGIVAVINPWRIFRGSARARFFFFPGLFLLKLGLVFVDAGAR